MKRSRGEEIGLQIGFWWSRFCDCLCGLHFGSVAVMISHADVVMSFQQLLNDCFIAEACFFDVLVAGKRAVERVFGGVIWLDEFVLS